MNERTYELLSDPMSECMKGRINERRSEQMYMHIEEMSSDWMVRSLRGVLLLYDSHRRLTTSTFKAASCLRGSDSEPRVIRVNSKYPVGYNKRP